MNKIIKTGESGSIIPGRVSIEYGINWKYSVEMTKEQMNSSNINFDELNKSKAWEFFLNELGLYPVGHDLCVLKMMIQSEDTRNALDLLKRIQKKVEKMYSW